MHYSEFKVPLLIAHYLQTSHYGLGVQYLNYLIQRPNEEHYIIPVLSEEMVAVGLNIPQDTQ